MSNNNYIIRENFMPEVYHQVEDDKELSTKQILMDNYDYICDSIKDENYKLENPYCSLFKELLYEDKVIGFATYDFTKGMGDLSLNEIYVLPEFRGNKYFINEIESTLMSGSTISIYEPTHRLIELLIENGYAENLDNNLVVSSINLDVNEKKLKSNNENPTIDDELIYACNLYDLNISACIILDDITTEETNSIFYSRCLNDDNKYFSSGDIRKNITPEYFDNIKKTILTNQDKYIKIIMDLEEKIPKAEFDIDEIVGRPPQFSEYLEGLINEEIVTKERALEIQKQMIDEFENDLILPESLFKRLEYLIMEDLIEDETQDIDFEDMSMQCSYCKLPVTPLDKSCKICGYKIEDSIDMFDEFEEMKNEIRDMIKQLRMDGISDKEIIEMTNETVNHLSDGSDNDKAIENMLLEIINDTLYNEK